MTEHVTSFDDLAVLAPVMLVVGDLKGWRRNGRDLPQLQGFHFVGFADITAELLRQITPDVILSALFGSDFDAMDVARRLEELGYTGRYRALTSTLPRPGLIRAEVAGVAPKLDFDLFIIDESGQKNPPHPDGA